MLGYFNAIHYEEAQMLKTVATTIKWITTPIHGTHIIRSNFLNFIITRATNLWNEFLKAINILDIGKQKHLCWG